MGLQVSTGVGLRRWSPAVWVHISAVRSACFTHPGLCRKQVEPSNKGVSSVKKMSIQIPRAGDGGEHWLAPGESHPRELQPPAEQERDVVSSQNLGREDGCLAVTPPSRSPRAKPHQEPTAVVHPRESPRAQGSLPGERMGRR